MKTNKELLTSVLKTTQMGQTGIRSVLDYAVKPGLKKELQSQLREYDSIEKEAMSIAASKGWELEELDLAIKAMSKMYAKTNLSFGSVDSKIAAMMIQGNTRGIIKGIKNLNHANDPDARIVALCQKLLDCEDANIHQVQGYL